MGKKVYIHIFYTLYECFIYEAMKTIRAESNHRFMQKSRKNFLVHCVDAYITHEISFISVHLIYFLFFIILLAISLLFVVLQYLQTQIKISRSYILLGAT